MKRKVKLQEQDELTNLYKLTIQNDWNEDYFVRLINNAELKAYIRAFGLKIKKEHEFNDWYCKLKKEERNKK